jgi:GNAT superfamily N-acetyltransferase
MGFQFSTYQYGPDFSGDYQRLRNFLIEVNRDEIREYDFEWVRWEWAHCLPFFSEERAGDIGIWERDGEIMAAILFEYGPGPGYPVLHPSVADDPELKRAMLGHAARKLRDDKGEAKLLIKLADRQFQRLARQEGYVPTPETEENAVLDLKDADLEFSLEPGARLVSLDEGFDLVQFHTTLWEGFNHEGPAPVNEDELAERRRQLYSPHGDERLKIAVIAADGEYAAYCGSWYDPLNDYLMIEPLATRPAYRRRGFARAAVMEACRRGAALGASRAMVGSNQQFYYSIGFDPLPAASFWRHLPAESKQPAGDTAKGDTA